VAPDAPTACTQWTAHEVAAHLAAGVEECNGLVGDALAGRPTRDTRSFAEREAPYLALPDEKLRLRLNEQLTLGVEVLNDFGSRRLLIHAVCHREAGHAIDRAQRRRG
jgi:hypothetical protein